MLLFYYFVTHRPSSASDSSPRISSCSSPVLQAGQQGDKKSATKDRSGTTNGSGISLMRKLTNSGKRKTKSPPFLSLDNPVFEEASNKNKNMGVEDNSCNGIAKTVKQMSAPLIRERYRCVTPYPANSEYELELQVGDIVYIHKKRDDGWFKGTLQRTVINFSFEIRVNYLRF
ncbi:hypothetical protein Anas_02670 [Armadillidium nasatum]|uniref:SH3 domain-containing protein n=1 Tax=Armadillidium nasatum TaxID=96803 RepID=A0A5N5TLN6_9CRUS|nr:hypothetical protein Anas_02670 [Armadillidium nasatum]